MLDVISYTGEKELLKIIREGIMYSDMNKILNILVIAILTMIVLISLLFFIRVSDKSHPYYNGADIRDSYAPYNPWNKAKNR